MLRGIPMVVQSQPGCRHRRAAFEDLDPDDNEVERQRLLIASLDEPPQRSTFIQLAPLAQGSPPSGRLDLDDLSTEFGADTRRKGAGDQGAEFDDFQSASGLLAIC